MNIENHLTTVGNQCASDEMPARPADPSVIYASLEGIEKEDSFADMVNG